MKWYEIFKVGQEVRVVKKVISWQFDSFDGGDGYTGMGASWVSDMDITIGKVFEVVEIDPDIGYRLNTEIINFYKQNFWYPVQSLQSLVGKQLLFDFMDK